MNRELRLARAVASGGVTELGETTPLETPKPTTWFRVDADYGRGWVLVGEANDRIGYLILADRAHKDRAKAVRVYRCEAVGGD